MTDQEKELCAKIREEFLDWKLNQATLVMKTLGYSLKESIQFVEGVVNE